MNKHPKFLPWVEGIPQYRLGKSAVDTAHEYGITSNKIVMVASNENPYGCSPLVKEFLKDAFKELNHWSYKEKETELLKKYILFWKNLKPYYNLLTKKLIAKKRAYQGKIYREAAKAIDEFIKKKNIVNHIFLGFNALGKAESNVIQCIIEQNQSNLKKISIFIKS